MIEKFNFYDIYGNLLPGIALVGLLWLPFGILLGVWPTSELSSAILALVFAYFIGHLIQISASIAVPSDVEWKSGPRRYPSDLVLDRDDRSLSAEIKQRLAKHISDKFHLDMQVSTDLSGLKKEELDALSRRRRDAFFQARGALLSNDAQSYAEQFEGLYAMMRGIAVAAALGSAYFLGYSASFFYAHGLLLAVFGLLGITFALMIFLGHRSNAIDSDLDREKKRWFERHFGCVLAIAVALSGMLLGWKLKMPHSRHLLFLSLAAASAIVAVRCHGAYKYFAKNFAKAVWRDFAYLISKDQPAGNNR